MGKRVCKGKWKESAMREARDKLILTLRFHDQTPKAGAPTYASYKQIGELVKLCGNRVRAICTQVVAGKRNIGKSQDQRKILEDRHIAFLTNQITLQQQVGRSLDERASLFM